MLEPWTEQTAVEALKDLVHRNLTVEREAVSLDLREDPARWDAAIRVLGRARSYALLADWICSAYLQKIGTEFFFTESCVAYELGYHINAYLWTQGFRGYPRHITTWFFSRKSLASHCQTVEIEKKSLRDIRQRVVFHYRKGLRNPKAE